MSYKYRIQKQLVGNKYREEQLEMSLFLLLLNQKGNNKESSELGWLNHMAHQQHPHYNFRSVAVQLYLNQFPNFE